MMRARAVLFLAFLKCALADTDSAWQTGPDTSSLMQMKPKQRQQAMARQTPTSSDSYSTHGSQREVVIKVRGQTTAIPGQAECAGNGPTGLQMWPNTGDIPSGRGTTGQRRNAQAAFYFVACKSNSEVWWRTDVNNIEIFRLPFVTAYDTDYYMQYTVRDNNDCTFSFGRSPDQTDLTANFICPTYFTISQNLSDYVLINDHRGGVLSEGQEVCDDGTKRRHCVELLRKQERATVNYYKRVGNPSRCQCLPWGDVHYKGDCGPRFDYQGSGPHTLVGLPGVDTQVFHCPVQRRKIVSIMVAVAHNLVDSDGNTYLVKWFRDAKTVNGQAITVGQWCLHGGTAVLLSQSTTSCPIIIIAGERNLEVIGPLVSGITFNNKIRRRNLSPGRSPVGYVFDMGIWLPQAQLSSATGICTADGPQSAATNVLARDATLFSDAEINDLWTNCCTDAPCDQPITEDPDLSEACNCTATILSEAQQACAGVEASFLNSCIIDYCGTCGDPAVREYVDSVEIEENYSNPNTLPGDINAPTANGDPHCRNLYGENFDVHTTGATAMVRVPRMGSARGQSLLVDAIIEPVSDVHCAPTVITRVDFRGSWLGEAGAFSLTPGPVDVPEVPEAWQKFMATHAANGNVSLRVRGTVKRMELRVGDVRVQVHQRKAKHYDKTYLELRVVGLDFLGKEAGGILGIDEHWKEATPQPGCEGHKIKLLGSAGRGFDHAEPFSRLMSWAEGWR